MRLSTPEMILSQGIGTSHTGDVVETALVNYTLPANIMTANGRLEITAEWAFTNSSNNKITRVHWGSTGILGTLFTTITFTTQATARTFCTISNNNSTAAQIGAGGGVTFGSSSSTTVTDNQNTATTPQLIAITGLLANTGETITLLTYCIKLYNF